jgi:hypothetical protein
MTEFHLDSNHHRRERSRSEGPAGGFESNHGMDRKVFLKRFASGLLLPFVVSFTITAEPVKRGRE